MTTIQSTDEGGANAVSDTPPAAEVARLWPLGIFFFLSTLFSWAVWLSPIDRQSRLLLFGFGLELKVPFLLMQLVIGNCLPGLLALIWTLVAGRGQFKSILSTLTHWRTPFRWYLVAAGLPWTVFLVAWSAVRVYSPTGYSLPPAVEFVTVFLITLHFGPLWEELAWRAFALRKLESSFSPRDSALLLGIYWAIWHIPMWLLQLEISSVNKIIFLVTAAINAIAWSVIFAYLYHRSSESLPVVILLHGAYAAASQVALADPSITMQVNYVVTVLSVCLAIAFARGLTPKPTYALSGPT